MSNSSVGGLLSTDSCKDNVDTKKAQLINAVAILAKKLVPKSSGKPVFTEDADNYGFAWLPPLENFESGETEGKKYVDLLHQDPIFYNPGSYDLMASCYNVEPYDSVQLGVQPLSWDYTSLRDRRLSRLSTALTVQAVELCRGGEYRNALAILKTALEQNPKNVEAIVAYGACNANLGHLDIAVYQFQHALSLDPTNSNAKKYLEQTNAKLQAIVLPSSTRSDTEKCMRNSCEMSVSGRHRSESGEVDSGCSDEGEGEGHRSGKKRRKEKHRRDESSTSHRHHKKKKSKHKKEHKKKHKKHSSGRKSKGQSHSSGDSSSETDQDPLQPQEDVGEEFHPILSRNKHKLWDM